MVRTRQDGFTLIETMVACVLLLVGTAGCLSILTVAARTTVTSRAREQATNLQRELVEGARSVSYDQLTPAGIGAEVRRRPGLSDASAAAGWTVRRRGTTYAVAMGVCTVDDPRDGTGPHEAGVFCADTGPPPSPPECASLLSAAGGVVLPGGSVDAGIDVPTLTRLGSCGLDVDLDGTVDGLVAISASLCAGGCSSPPDPNPADFKRAVSTVTWPGGTNRQTTQVNNPGPSAAPAVTDLVPQALVVSDTRSSVGLASTTTGRPRAVAVYLDGTAMTTATSADAVTWTATWQLGAVTTAAGGQPGPGEVVDGSYQLSEKAFDAYGQYGAARSETIVVNRRRPFAPAYVAAGHNGSGVEVEWSLVRERDVTGYRVDRRVGGGAWAVACAPAQRTSCRDDDTLAGDLRPDLEYSVVALDRDASGAPRTGDRSAIRAIPLIAPPVPGTPPSLQAAAVPGGVQLTWTAPGGLPVPDHYNVYRGGPGHDDRLDSVVVASGRAPSFLDTTTTGVAQDYWVTAVNAQLGESAPIGPVRR